MFFRASAEVWVARNSGEGMLAPLEAQAESALTSAMAAARPTTESSRALIHPTRMGIFIVALSPKPKVPHG